METCSPAYPRPQLERAHWLCLDGSWRFAFDSERRYSDPSQIDQWPLTIKVPFIPCRAKVMDRQVEQVGTVRGGDINRPQRVRMRIKLLNDGSKLDNLWSGPKYR